MCGSRHLEHCVMCARSLRAWGTLCWKISMFPLQSLRKQGFRQSEQNAHNRSGEGTLVLSFVTFELVGTKQILHFGTTES